MCVVVGYVCSCAHLCVCACMRERERKTHTHTALRYFFMLSYFAIMCMTENVFKKRTCELCEDILKASDADSNIFCRQWLLMEPAFASPSTPSRCSTSVGAPRCGTDAVPFTTLAR